MILLGIILNISTYTVLFENCLKCLKAYGFESTQKQNHHRNRWTAQGELFTQQSKRNNALWRWRAKVHSEVHYTVSVLTICLRWLHPPVEGLRFWTLTIPFLPLGHENGSCHWKHFVTDSLKADSPTWLRSRFFFCMTSKSSPIQADTLIGSFGYQCHGFTILNIIIRCYYAALLLLRCFTGAV